MSEAILAQLEKEDKEFAKLKTEIDELLTEMNKYTHHGPLPACAEYAINNLKETSGGKK